MKELSKELIEKFMYSLESPTSLVWAVNIYRGRDEGKSVLREVGDTAGYIGQDGYARVFLKDYGTVLAHRVIWRMFYDELPKGYFVITKMVIG